MASEIVIVAEVGGIVHGSSPKDFVIRSAKSATELSDEPTW